MPAGDVRVIRRLRVKAVEAKGVGISLLDGIVCAYVGIVGGCALMCYGTNVID